jgi:hypothetical protein
MRKRPFALGADLLRPLVHAPLAVFVAMAAAVLVAAVVRVGVKYSFNVNEGWNAYWAATAWSGADLYPPPTALKLNTYLPLWFYLTGALGSLVGDNIVAGRVIAGAALLSNALVIFLIVRVMTGLRRDGVTAAAAFLAMSGLFYGQYLAADDPQWAGNFLMTLALLLIVRNADGEKGAIPVHLVVPLLLVAGLLKHNVVAIPASIALYLVLFRRAELPRSILWSIAGLASVCALLFLLFGSGIFASLLFPRRYDLTNAFGQAFEHLLPYVPFLGLIVYLAVQKERARRLIFIYSLVSLAQGLVLSGGFDVDVNVFFDFAIACSIAIGLLQRSVAETVGADARRLQSAFAMTAWLAITMTPVTVAAVRGFTELRDAFDSTLESSQRDDIAYIKASSGAVICQNLALCYWAGKDFRVDMNNLKMLALASPRLEAEFISKLEGCRYSLIQLSEDWDDLDEGPFTSRILEAIEKYSKEIHSSAEAYYRTPVPPCGAP